MIRHRRVRKLLYEYLHGELESSEQRSVEQHLVSCPHCSNELKDLESAVNLLRAHTRQPSDTRPPGFWNAFAFRVEDRIREGGARRGTSGTIGSLAGRILLLHRRLLVAFASGLAAIVVFTIAFLMSRHSSQQTQERISEQHPLDQQAPAELVSDRLHTYFSKSKVLLVGLSNMKTGEDQEIDLSGERKLSRELIYEARYLHGQPIDTRSARLIGDLEKILVELANTKEQNGLPDVDVIRGGIHQENLLFKIRMAESMYDTTQFLQANNRY